MGNATETFVRVSRGPLGLDEILWSSPSATGDLGRQVARDAARTFGEPIRVVRVKALVSGDETFWVMPEHHDDGNCDRCGEPLDDGMIGRSTAEVHDPTMPSGGEYSMVVHADPCAANLISRGWEIA